MKRAAWQVLLAGATLILAMPTVLRAQQPEQLPEPASVMNRSASQQRAANPRSNPPDDTGPADMQQDDSSGPMFDDQGNPYDNGPAYPYSSSRWWRDGCWYGEFDFVVWHRNRAHDGILSIDTSGILRGQRQDLNRHGSPLGLEPGAEGTLGYIFDRDIDNRDHSIEFTYLGFNNWESHDSLVAETPGDLRAPIAPNYGGFNFGDSANSFYRSSLQTMEIGYRIRNRPEQDRMLMGPDGFWSRQLTPGRTQSVIFGLSGVQLNEDFQWNSLANGVSPAVFSGSFHTHTDNTLLGPQIGGDWYDVHQGWYWGVRGKVGVYANFSRGSADIVVEDPNVPEDPVHHHTTSQTPAGYGKLSFLSGINVSENIMVFGSFDAAVIGGVAMAPDQVSFFSDLAGSPPTMNTGGHIFYNGFSIGMECYW